jgi:hypothetical protein
MFICHHEMNKHSGWLILFKRQFYTEAQRLHAEQWQLAGRRAGNRIKTLSKSQDVILNGRCDLSA